VTSYIIRRIVQLVVVVFIVSVLVFGIMRALPGDPILLLISGQERTADTPAVIAQLRHDNGLDRSYVVQYVSWIGGALKGNLGKSIDTGNSVSSDLLTHLGVGAGVLCAVKRGTWIDSTVTALANAGTTVPVFWLALMLILVFGVWLGWLPTFGYTSPFVDFGQNLRGIILPVMCLALFPMASVCRQTRSAMLGVLHQDYIRTAWSKGLKQRAVIVKHALKNTLIPIVTLSGMTLGAVVGGAVFEETVFVIPGMGNLAVNAVNNQDYPVIQGITLFVAFVVLVVNLLVDISYGWLDPRIRYS
jgi:peptide/nickel transport system permease protein